MYWKAVLLLLGTRQRLVSRTFARSSAALAGVLLFNAVFGPAAFAAGSACETRLKTLPGDDHAVFLWSIFILLQVAWLLLLLAGGVGGIGSRLSPEILRPYPVPPRAFVTAAALGSLTDLPTLLALPLFWGVYRSFPAQVTGPSSVLPAFALLALQVPVLEQAARSGFARFRRRPLSVRLLLAGGIGLALLLSATWGTVAAESVQRGMPLLTALPTVLLLAQTALTLFLADRWLTGQDERAAQTVAKPGRIGSLAPEFARPEWSRMAVAATVEWRNLLQNLPAHLPLRLPAQLAIGVFFAWIAPNMGNDALLNARDLCCMGSLLYFVVWQVQLLTNRWGSEAGTAALLLGFPMSRRRLLLVRNAALLSLLLPLDCLLAVAVCLLLKAPQAVWATLGGTALVLILFTAFGNLVSAVSPYPIARRTEGFFVEPDRSLLFTYILIGVATSGLFWAVSFLPPPLPAPALFLITVGLYAGSILSSANLLQQRETDIIARLDGE